MISNLTSTSWLLRITNPSWTNSVRLLLEELFCSIQHLRKDLAFCLWSSSTITFDFFPARSLIQDFQDDLSRVARAVNTDLLESNHAPSSIASGWCTDDVLDEECHGKKPEIPWMSMVTWKNKETRQRAWGCKAVLGDIQKLVEGQGELEIYEVKFQPVISKP